MKSRNWDYKNFAEATGINKSYAWRLEKGERETLTKKMADQIGSALGVSSEWIRFGTGDSKRIVDTSTVRPATGLRVIKILGYIPVGFHDGNVSDEAVIGLTSNNSVPDGCYALIADGDCMEPTVRNGDLIFFKPGNGARPKDLVITVDENNHAMLKRYGENKDGRGILTCDNKKYDPITEGPETRIVGIVVKVLHDAYTRPGLA